MGLKEKWIEALRSGKYEQGVGVLRSKNGEKERYCCLGVLCDVSGLGEWKDGTEYSGKRFQMFDEGGGGDTAILPWPLAKKLNEVLYGEGHVLREEDRAVALKKGLDFSMFKSEVLQRVIRDKFEEYGECLLATINDTGEASFEEVADFLEINFGGGE